MESLQKAPAPLVIVERNDMFRQAELQQILQTIPWFLELSESQLERLVAIASVQHLLEGECLFHEGDTEGNVYILLDGEMTLDIQIPGREKVRKFYGGG